MKTTAFMEKGSAPITRHLLNWYNENKRDMPWRETSDPYLIWVSEVILQQTRVAQGWDYYVRFTRRFPTVQSLASASEEEVLMEWQGLGYYSRARNMHAAARDIMDRFNGEFPTRYNDILSLKGIGEYTASAISSIAFNEPHAAVDGNVLRVIARLFAMADPIGASKGKKAVTGIARSLMPLDNPAAFNQAIMDFGSLICTPAQPKCDECPLQDYCMGYSLKRPTDFPVNAKKKEPKKRYFHYFHILHNGSTYITRRVKQDIWKNLYEFPLVETSGHEGLDHLLESPAFKELFAGIPILPVDPPSTFKHVLSHQLIHASFYRVVLSGKTAFNPPGELLKIKRDQLGLYPIARLTRKYLESMDDSCGK